MYAVEFDTSIKDGVIRIPKEYENVKENQNAKVIILLKENLENSEIKSFSNHTAELVDEWKDDTEDEVWK